MSMELYKQESIIVTLSPKERYQHDLARDDFEYDPAQAKAVDALQEVYESLMEVSAQSEQTKPIWQRIFSKKSKVQYQAVKGLYLWGGVGRGKTYLIDSFFDAIPFENKVRVHFYCFMRRVHDELKAFSGEKIL